MCRFHFCTAVVLILTLAQGARSEAVPDPNRGLYAIWTKPGVGDDQPFLKGGQAIVQWREVEPSEGHYDFSKLHARLEELDRLGRATTVQLNGNMLPAYLFAKVPYLPVEVSTYQDSRGTPQYWHPAYLKAYTDLIAAFAREVKSSRYRSRVVGVRLNYDGIGTEHMIVPPQYRDAKRWVVPPGVEAAPPWSEEIAAAYCRTVLDTFLRSFSPDIRVLMRSHLPAYSEPDQQSLRVAEAGQGKLGFLYTACDIEAKTPAQAGVFEKVFLHYCRPGTMVCYGEQVSDSTGEHPKFNDPRWTSPEQWNYWRLLSDLNLGFSIIGVFGWEIEKVDNPEYRGAFDFAARYVGYHASPSVAPGAWVALREGGRQLKGDYTFLMRRLPGAPVKAEQKIGPAGERFGAWAVTLPKGAELKFALDPVFSRSLKKATVRVVYLDQGAGRFALRAADREFPAELAGSGRWKTVEFDVNQPGIDLSITASADVTLHMIEVVRGNLP